MVSKVNSAGIFGVDGHRIICECDLSGGMPRFDIVGLPDASVKESQDRVRAAIKNCGFEFPMRRITVNLAPGQLRKEGPIYDLPILVGILAASNQIPSPDPQSCFIGELSLEGSLRPAGGILPMALAAKAFGMTSIFVPEDNAAEATIADITVYPVKNVQQLAAHIKGENLIDASEKYVFHSTRPQALDFSHVMGQETVKRGLEIAAAGSHNVLLIGPPGSGKSMLSKRIPSILPDLTEEEALELTKIYSVAGLLSRHTPMMTYRPFRSPHHTVSTVGLAGGGRIPKPGEISLSHNGVLFLDELPEFRPDALEVLRQPLEDGSITVSRINATCTYPSRFMLVCAMNPCKCGYYGHPSGRCTCSDQSVRNYMKRISGPMLDRIDIHLNVNSVLYNDLKNRTPAESSENIRTRVNAARKIQTARYKGKDYHCNAHLAPADMSDFCTIDSSGQNILKSAFDALGLTARAYDKILKVARTIADLAGSWDISADHIAEAIQFRTLDREDMGL